MMQIARVLRADSHESDTKMSENASFRKKRTEASVSQNAVDGDRRGGYMKSSGREFGGAAV
jgi:hypothetical protein